ncbi:MAG: hypothetical protein JRG96_11285, partial [Deltaproteobacteria bacterium]|nr:hypothetical protein [Deltaproteobacteria bacterium]
MNLKAMVAFVGAGMLTFALSTTSFAGVCTDTDSDGVCDPVDNCVTIANPGQRDDDLDGMGNICDADITQDCIIGAPDGGQVSGNLGGMPPWGANPNGNGTIGSADITEDDVIGAPDGGK